MPESVEFWRWYAWFVSVALVVIVLLFREYIRDFNHREEEWQRTLKQYNRHIENLQSIAHKMNTELAKQGVDSYFEADEQFAWLIMEVPVKEEKDAE